MSRSRRRSDDLYNQRRRIRRVVERTERDINRGTLSKTDIKRARKYVARLRGALSETYVKGRGKKAAKDMERASKKLSSLGNEITTGRNKSERSIARRNRIFINEMKNATSGGMALGKYGSLRVKVFFRATQEYWEGVPADKRYDAIMRETGYTDLRKLFDRIMGENERVFKYNATQVDNSDTINNDMDNDTGSPIVLSLVRFFRMG